jgi:hypothetical protein
LGSVAELAENADEAAPWDLGEHTDPQLDFRILAAVNANERFREFGKGATGESHTEVADRTVHGLKEVPWRPTRVLIEVWCGWDPEESDLEEICRQVALGEDAICTLQEVASRWSTVHKTSTTRKR